MIYEKIIFDIDVKFKKKCWNLSYLRYYYARGLKQLFEYLKIKV